MKTKNSKYIIILSLSFLINLFMVDVNASETSKQYGNFKLISQKVFVELFADGSYISIGENKSINISDSAIKECIFWSSINTTDKVLDYKGNELKFITNKEPNVYKYTVILDKAIDPGKELIIKTINKRTKASNNNTEINIYQKRHIPGPAINYSETIKLPENTELISVIPKPSKQYIEKNRTFLQFEQKLNKGQAFYCKIIYKTNSDKDISTNNQNQPSSNISDKGIYYFEIMLNNVVCGYAEFNVSETEKDGQKIKILDQYNYIKFTMMKKTAIAKQNLIYHINPETGKFIYHSSYTEQQGTIYSSEIIINDNKATFKSPDNKDDMELDLQPDVILPNTFFYKYLLDDFGATNLKEKTYKSFDVREFEVQEVTYTRLGNEKLKLSDNVYDAIIFNEFNKKFGMNNKIWVDSKTGMRLKNISDSHIDLSLSDASVKNKMQIANWDDIAFIKTNELIKNISDISYMKVNAIIESFPPVKNDILNFPGQIFSGEINGNSIEGIFEINQKKYDGTNAPEFPTSYSNNGLLKEFLNPEPAIESNNPVLVNKAKEITKGKKNSWDAVCSLSKWVVENIDGAITGGNSAMQTYESGEGECAAQSKLFAALCRSVGIPARVVIGGLYTPLFGGSFGPHAWNEVYMGKAGWIPVDATIEEPDYINSGHVKIGTLHTQRVVINFKKMKILDYKISRN
ncbi:transglutaminase family protein [Bacteroidota bacterium]